MVGVTEAIEIKVADTLHEEDLLNQHNLLQVQEEDTIHGLKGVESDFQKEA